MASNEERRQQVKEEKARKKKGDLKVKAIKYALGCQIIKFEKRCFGWHYVGHTVDDDVSYEVTDSGKVKKNHKIIKYAYFNRPRVWKNNFLFGLTETLSNIFSFCRRLMINLIIVGIALAVIPSTRIGTLITYGVVFVGSFLFAGLGLLWKKLFKLEEKTDEILTESGYDVWSANEDGETIAN